MNKMRFVVQAVVLGCLLGAAGHGQIIGQQLAPQIGVSENGVPIRAYGEVYVLDESPDFQPGNVLQHGNDNPKKKIKPLKSWEFENNYFGATPPRVPRTAHNDRQFYLPVNLIDGNTTTWWASRNQGMPNLEPEWVRIDLAQDRVIGTIELVPLGEALPERGINPGWGESARYYNPWPGKLTVKVSLDEWHWDTVFQTDQMPRSELGKPFTIHFPARPIKQIWITGELLDRCVQGPFLDFWGHAWAMSEVRVIGEGANWALAGRGAGVTTSSTNYGYQGRRQEMADWWSLQYDMGLKWLRVAFWTSVLNWHYVEQEKGVYKVDSLADQTIAEAHANGVKVVMGLEYGNWLYTDTPKDNFAARVETMPFDPAPVPWKDEHIEGYLNFVRFMVDHFRGRVFAWELWNEPLQDHRYGWGPDEKGFKKYREIIQRVVPVIREIDPEVKIMASGTLGRMLDVVAPEIDIIDVVRYYENPLDSAGYRNQHARFLDFKKFIESKGFKGKYYFSQENQWHGSPYPYPTLAKIQTSEIGQAKNLTRTMARHAGMGIVGFWNETWNSALRVGDVGLLRHGFNSGPAHRMTARPGYYAYRTLCTALADCEPDPTIDAKLEAEAAGEMIDLWTFRHKDGDVVVALWLKGDARDRNSGEMVQVVVPVKTGSAIGYDVLNGIEQEMNLTPEGEATRVQNLQVYDYPLVLRFKAGG